MATEKELIVLVTWLEEQGFCLKRHREVTLSYATLVFGDSTVEHLRSACRFLQRHRTRPIHWLALRRLSLPLSATATATGSRTAAPAPTARGANEIRAQGR